MRVLIYLTKLDIHKFDVFNSNHTFQNKMYKTLINNIFVGNINMNANLDKSVTRFYCLTFLLLSVRLVKMGEVY